MNPAPTPHAELRVPHPGEAIAATVGYAIGLLLLAVAAGNLLHFTSISLTAIVASILWISLMAFVVSWNVWDEGGVRHYLINRLGQYSRRHFIRAESTNGERRDCRDWLLTVWPRLDLS